jgi:hypothetical protein
MHTESSSPTATFTETTALPAAPALDQRQITWLAAEHWNMTKQKPGMRVCQVDTALRGDC